MRLCWADKIPLVLFGLISVVLLVLGGLGPTDSEYCRYLRLDSWRSSCRFRQWLETGPHHRASFLLGEEVAAHT
jgi:hypothetical protein